MPTLNDFLMSPLLLDAIYGLGPRVGKSKTKKEEKKKAEAKSGPEDASLVQNFVKVGSAPAKGLAAAMGGLGETFGIPGARDLTEFAQQGLQPWAGTELGPHTQAMQQAGFSAGPGMAGFALGGPAGFWAGSTGGMWGQAFGGADPNLPWWRRAGSALGQSGLEQLSDPIQSRLLGSPLPWYLKIPALGFTSLLERTEEGAQEIPRVAFEEGRRPAFQELVNAGDQAGEAALWQSLLYGGMGSLQNTQPSPTPELDLRGGTANPSPEQVQADAAKIAADIVKNHNASVKASPDGKTNIGSTTNVVRGNLAGQDAWAVAVAPELMETSEGPELTMEEVYPWVLKNYVHVLKNPDLSFGTWHNTKDGKVYKDLVGTPDHESARYVGNELGENAIYGLKDGVEEWLVPQAEQLTLLSPTNQDPGGSPNLFQEPWAYPVTPQINIESDPYRTPDRQSQFTKDRLARIESPEFRDRIVGAYEEGINNAKWYEAPKMQDLYGQDFPVMMGFFAAANQHQSPDQAATQAQQFYHAYKNWVENDYGDFNKLDEYLNQVKGLGQIRSNARRIIEGVGISPTEDKLTRFYANLMGQADPVTWDLWMTRLGMTQPGEVQAFGDSIKHLSPKDRIQAWSTFWKLPQFKPFTRGEYARAEEVVQDIGRDIQVPSRELQAGGWEGAIIEAANAGYPSAMRSLQGIGNVDSIFQRHFDKTAQWLKVSPGDVEDMARRGILPTLKEDVEFKEETIGDKAYTSTNTGHYFVIRPRLNGTFTLAINHAVPTNYASLSAAQSAAQKWVDAHPIAANPNPRPVSAEPMAPHSRIRNKMPQATPKTTMHKPPPAPPDPATQQAIARGEEVYNKWRATQPKTGGTGGRWSYKLVETKKAPPYGTQNLLNFGEDVFQDLYFWPGDADAIRRPPFSTSAPEWYGTLDPVGQRMMRDVGRGTETRYDDIKARILRLLDTAEDLGHPAKSYIQRARDQLTGGLPQWTFEIEAGPEHNLGDWEKFDTPEEAQHRAQKIVDEYNAKEAEDQAVADWVESLPNLDATGPLEPFVSDLIGNRMVVDPAAAQVAKDYIETMQSILELAETAPQAAAVAFKMAIPAYRSTNPHNLNVLGRVIHYHTGDVEEALTNTFAKRHLLQGDAAYDPESWAALPPEQQDLVRGQAIKRAGAFPMQQVSDSGAFYSAAETGAAYGTEYDGTVELTRNTSPEEIWTNLGQKEIAPLEAETKQSKSPQMDLPLEGGRVWQQSTPPKLSNGTVVLFQTEAPSKFRWAEGKHRWIGQEVTSPNHVVQMSRYLEDATVEHYNIIYVKGRTVVGHDGGTDKNPVMANPVSPDKVEQKRQRLGADKVYMVHNHPTGSIRFSGLDGDVGFAMALKIATGDHLAGFSVLGGDANRLASIHADGYITEENLSPRISNRMRYKNWFVPRALVKLTENREGVRVDLDDPNIQDQQLRSIFRQVDASMGTSLSRPDSSAGSKASVLSPDNIGLVFVNADRQVVGVEVTPKNQFNDPGLGAKWLRYRAREHGAYQTFAVIAPYQELMDIVATQNTLGTLASGAIYDRSANREDLRKRPKLSKAKKPPVQKDLKLTGGRVRRP